MLREDIAARRVQQERDNKKTKSITRLLENLKVAFENLGETIINI